MMAGWLFCVSRRGAAVRTRAATTLSFADVVTDLGATGLGSLDVLVERGRTPVVVARAYDDQPDRRHRAGDPRVRRPRTH